RDVVVAEVERLLQRLEEPQLGGRRPAVRPGDGRSQPEGELARRLVGQPLRDRGEDVRKVSGVRDLLRGVRDRLSQIACVDAMELRPLEDTAIDLLDLDLADVSV